MSSFFKDIREIVDPKFVLSEEQIVELVEEKFTSTNSARDAITPLVVRAVTTDGCHHKQWYLEAIAEALQIELPPHDLGIAP